MKIRKKYLPRCILSMSSWKLQQLHKPGRVGSLYFLASRTVSSWIISGEPGKLRKNYVYRKDSSIKIIQYLPLFSLIRDFGKQNTHGNVSKISVSLACYRQIGLKSTNHSLLIEVTLQQPFGITFCTPRVENVPDMCGINYK